MTFSILSWAILSLTGGLLTLWAVWARHVSRWRLVSLLGFLMSILVSGAAVYMSMGWASNCNLLLPGKYSLIAWTYDAKKITLFLETQFGPKACYIPYDDRTAEELQKNDEDGGSEFQVDWDHEGGGTWGLPGGEGDGGHLVGRPPSEHKEKPAEETPPIYGE